MAQSMTAHAAPTKSRTTKQRNPAVSLSKNDHLLRWVEKMAQLTQPARIHWVDGSQEENDAICAEMVQNFIHDLALAALARVAGPGATVIERSADGTVLAIVNSKKERNEFA